MSRMPSLADLADWVEGRLEGEPARLVAEFVAVDPDAARTVAWIEQFLADAAAMPLQKPPPELSARLRAAFNGHQEATGPDGWSDAELLHDTRQQRVAGIRSAGVGEAAHLAFESDAGRFVLEVRAAGNGAVDIEGLVLVEDRATEVVLTFLETDVVRRIVRAEAGGRFEARDVPDTVDELRLDVDGARVRARLDLRRA